MAPLHGTLHKRMFGSHAGFRIQLLIAAVHPTYGISVGTTFCAAQLGKLALPHDSYASWKKSAFAPAFGACHVICRHADKW